MIVNSITIVLSKGVHMNEYYQIQQWQWYFVV